jgi:hypothetical protein
VPAWLHPHTREPPYPVSPSLSAPARLRNDGGDSWEEKAPPDTGGEADSHVCADEAVRALKPSCIKAGVDAAIEAMFPRARAHRRRSQALGAERRAPGELYARSMQACWARQRPLVANLHNLGGSRQGRASARGRVLAGGEAAIGDRAPGCLRRKSTAELHGATQMACWSFRTGYGDEGCWRRGCGQVEGGEQRWEKMASPGSGTA